MEFFAAFILTLFFKIRNRHLGSIALASISAAWLIMASLSTALVCWYAEPAATDALNSDLLFPLLAKVVFGVIAGLVAPRLWISLPEKVREAL